MKKIKDMTQAELAAFVQSHLESNDIKLILSGGAVVAIYTNGSYVSLDIDFIPYHYIKSSNLNSKMLEIGFQKEGRHFIHPDSEYIIEFPPSPPSIGSEPIEKYSEIKLDTGMLRLLTPTDCVKDRLSAYYHWGDRQGLAQAIMVAKSNKIDKTEVERWSRIEGKLEDYKIIETELIGKYK